MKYLSLFLASNKGWRLSLALILLLMYLLEHFLLSLTTVANLSSSWAFVFLISSLHSLMRPLYSP